tara:strand:- start:1 stop:816 length:816 start_codon:yes stop_codon:yes gene_type:complete
MDIKKLIKKEILNILENINDPMLKSLRTTVKGEKFPNLKQWWTYQPEDIMTYVYWHQGQLPPSDPKKFEKEYNNIVKQLHVQYPIPASALPKVDVDDETERALSVDAPDSFGEGKLNEAYIWDKTGDSQDRKYFSGLVDWAKKTYSAIAPKNYNLDNFENDLDKVAKQAIVPEMDNYAAASKPFSKQTPEERKYTKKVWEDWHRAFGRVFRTTTSWSGYKAATKSFHQKLGTFFKVMMMAHAGDTSSMGYKVMKRWKDTEKAKHDKKFGTS